MTGMIQSAPDAGIVRQRERLLRVLALATFIIFFQGYMMAPIIPLLANALRSPEQVTGLVVPAYLIPYGISTLVYGLIADRIGIHRVMLASLVAFSVLTLLTVTARDVEQLMLFRIATGIGASGVVPLALAIVGRLYPYEQRGRALGWLFGAMAGGMAFGSPLGAMLAPWIGWRGLFVAVAAGAFALVPLLYLRCRFIAAAVPPMPSSLRDVASGYKELLRNFRGIRTYAYVLVNSMFHSGVFTWLGFFLERKHGLGPAAVGVALLGYGVPGFLLGPFIGRVADRWGRARLIPLGLLLGSGAATALALDPPAALAPVVAIVLSLGYDMTQPLFGGIITSLGGKRAGQAMGLNVFTLFVGFGLGSIGFGALLGFGFGPAFLVFAGMELLLGLLAFTLFRSELPARSRSR
ncbi:MAG TPA: MFS transporter [Acidocella sp.]|jgi:predicted MFS family arabinose efflux permease|uniref:MFS transporter n=1 Tax=Acidocella sp. TaxID=50710 RepID=UPI002B6D1146|nr:MFS transporter [Acidocella sp.]HVE21887.1 MFS transporter [Acidocella sp.]